MAGVTVGATVGACVVGARVGSKDGPLVGTAVGALDDDGHVLGPTTSGFNADGRELKMRGYPLPSSAHIPVDQLHLKLVQFDSLAHLAWHSGARLAPVSVVFGLIVDVAITPASSTLTSL